MSSDTYSASSHHSGSTSHHPKNLNRPGSSRSVAQTPDFLPFSNITPQDFSGFPPPMDDIPQSPQVSTHSNAVSNFTSHPSVVYIDESILHHTTHLSLPRRTYPSMGVVRTTRLTRSHRHATRGIIGIGCSFKQGEFSLCPPHCMRLFFHYMCLFFYYMRQTYVKTLTDTAAYKSRNTQDSLVQPIYEGMATLTAGMKRLSDLAAGMERLSDEVQECRTMLQSNASSTGSVPSLLPQLNKDNYRTKHWAREEHLEHRKNGRESGKGPILSEFMEDGQGNPIPEPVRKDARLMARGYFDKLLRDHQQPETWGAMPLDNRHELFNLLETHFEWLRYCDGHWKVDKLCQNVYSPWHSNVQEQCAKAAEAATPAVDENDQDEVHEVSHTRT